MQPAVDLPRALCADEPIASRREWMVTNGIGGYAMGTVSGIPTRRYHGLLVAALDPPLGRTLLVGGLHESVTVDDVPARLGAARWADGAVDPTGFVHLDRFHLDGTTPVWTYAVADAVLEKRVWMEPGGNATYVRYTLRRARQSVRFTADALVTFRDHHALTSGDGWEMYVTTVPDGLRVDPYDEAAPLFLRSDGASVVPGHAWYRDFQYDVEAYRGLDAVEDQLCAGRFVAEIEPGDALTLALSTTADAPVDAEAAWARRTNHESRLLVAAGLADAPTPDASRGEPEAVNAECVPPRLRQLVLAADAFVVERPANGAPDGTTIIAGYPWFGDWGRDTMIALPGLTLATGRPDVATRVLRTFARYVDRGMLPNRFPDAGADPEYNTVDATLWYVEAIRATYAATEDATLLDDLFPVLHDVVDAHVEGTRYGIGVDPSDGLLRAGEPGVQLTWMDAKVDDWVVTPRIGKPVEVNALWHHALCCMADFARTVGGDPDAYADRAERVRRSFQRFWDAGRGHCLDVIDGPDGRDDASLRPNQLLAVSLAHSPLSAAQQRSVVDACAAQLLTPHGLRSLSPDHDAYVGRYGGSPRERDGAYHQGTVWAWWIGPFVDAHLRVYDDPTTAQTFLEPLLGHLDAHGVGSVSEIFDGDPPHTPRGAPAQAWSVAELLRAGQRIRKSRRNHLRDG